jgi:long-chain acyl-CoA synthetase
LGSESLIGNLDKLVQQDFIQQLPPVLTQSSIDWQIQIPSKIEFEIDKLQPEELCALLYTSGTTGVPKGVMLSSINAITNAMQAYVRFQLLNLNSNDSFFCVLPLFHVFAQCTCLWLPIMTGSPIIIVAKIDRKLIFDGLKHKPSLFLGFPALYGLLCMMKNAPLNSIKIFVSGADMLPDKIRAGFANVYGRKICAGYGLSEASPVVAVNHTNPTTTTNNVGRPLVGIECEIRDDNENKVENGVVGNIWIKGDNIMLGYYKAPENTATILKNGWLNTGDLGMITENRTLAICGRTKDIIIHKGFNIYPAEIENILLRHPSVFKAAVVGKKDPDSGQIPVAFVAVKPGDPGLEATLRGLCVSNLATYKVPRKIICLDDLPMNATGKVDKKQLPT